MTARLVPLLVACLPLVATADVEMRFSDGSTILVGDGRVLFGDSANSVLYVPGRDGLVILNRAQQTFLEMQPGFADKLAAEAAARRERMLAELTPEQRALVEDEITGPEPEQSEFSVKRTGNRREIAGYGCHEAEIVDGSGETKEIVCIASPDDLGIPDDDFQALTGFMVKLAEIAAMAPDDDSFIDLDALGGVPVRTEDIDYGKVSELLSVSTAAVDEDRLEIPEEYAEIPAERLLTQ